MGAMLAYAFAAVFAYVWEIDAAFRKQALGGALAAFFLLAEPAYTSGAAYRALAKRSTGAAGFIGAATGVVLAALYLIPRLQPSVIFAGAAALVLIVAFGAARHTSPELDTNGLSLNGKSALITGVGDRGQLGYAIAERFIAAGARVCITARTDAVIELARALSHETVGVACDLTIEEDVARLAATATRELGGLDILVNVAGGLTVIKPLGETTAEEWRREVQRNAETAFLVTCALLPALRATRGSIINFASPAGQRAAANVGAYSAGKAAVIALTRALALEEKENGVRVNAIAPGMIDTTQNRAAVNDANVKWVTREQVTNAVLFLAGDAASGITGETIQVVGEGLA